MSWKAPTHRAVLLSDSEMWYHPSMAQKSGYANLPIGGLFAKNKRPIIETDGN